MATISTAADQPKQPAATASPPAGHRDVNTRKLARMGWLFTSPALIVIAAVTIFPIIYSVIMSLTNVTASAGGFTLGSFTGANYNALIHAAVWRQALAFTVGYTVVTVLAEVIIGTAIALVLERLVAGRGWVMALLLIPWSMITVINAELWDYIYEATYGVLQWIAGGFGLGHPDVLASPWPARIAMGVADTWKCTPFVAIIVLAGLVMLPQDVYEAAEVDGANGWTTFWRITFPLLRPTIALAVMFRVLQAFGLFDLTYVLTNGGPGSSTTSLALLGYKAMFENLDFGGGAAVATSTALLVLLGCLVSLRVFRVQVGKED